MVEHHPPIRIDQDGPVPIGSQCPDGRIGALFEHSFHSLPAAVSQVIGFQDDGSRCTDEWIGTGIPGNDDGCYDQDQQHGQERPRCQMLATGAAAIGA